MEKVDNSIYLEYVKEDDNIELDKLLESLKEEKCEELEYIDYIEEDNDNDLEDIITQVNEEKNWNLEYIDSHEEDDEVTWENIDIDDLDTYKRVTLNYKENIKLENIVINEVNKLCTNDMESHRELKRKIMDLVRKNSMYTSLSNKNKLSCCVTSVLNKNNVLYTFKLECKIFEIFIGGCDERFEEVEDLLKELKEDIEETVNKYNYHAEEYFTEYEYKCKLEEIGNIIDKMIVQEQYIFDSELKYKLLEFIDIRTSKEINSKYKNIQSTRIYRSKERSSSKEETRRKAIELKNKGIGNNHIARTLGKSKGYISDLLRNKK